ncbi:hypothetical protein MSG28_008078 [Choristoneura fumiferana]|uniref:Uncharacterized protein n=1 Tax=Choristoneura fumiferana TaxID=7141 RepID=A0ACC0J9V9_CHOFU|nr:hypothetical protein MSG28_008078 [Choristoneura fumiferana]
MRYVFGVAQGRELPTGQNVVSVAPIEVPDESLYPRFAEPIPNVTVTVGRDALLACVVDNLRGFKNPRISLSYNDHRSWYLHIKSVQEVDRGWYMCQVNTDPMRSRKGYLQVVVPPSIIDNMTSTDMVVREGSDVSLVCRASGYPEPYVMWRREDGQDFNYNGESGGKYEAFPMDSGYNKFMMLKIRNITKEDFGFYKCIAKNSLGETDGIIKLDERSNPRISLSYNDHRSWYLHIKSVQEVDRGWYMCQVNTDPMRSRKGYLQVVVPPSIIDNMTSTDMVVREGSDVSLVCRASGYPEPYVMWRREDGQDFNYNGESGGKYEAFPMDSGYNKFMMLKIRNITKEDFGFYKCIAKNSLGETDGIIKLDAPPSAFTTQKTVIDNQTIKKKAGLLHKLNLTRPKYFICSPLFWEVYGDILRNLDYIDTFICFDDSKDISLSIKNLILRPNDVTNFEPATVQGQIDTALILYSSGTTGMPKGVQLTHLNCILNSLPKDFEDESLKTAFMFGEWYHNYDTFMTYKFLSAGRKIVYVDTVTPENLMKSIHNCQVNIAMLVPSLVGYLSKAEEVEKYDLSTLKIIYCRSSPLHRKTIEAVKRRYTHYVAPLELETILQLHPGVREAGVVGQPAGDIGELPTAFVVCQRGATVSPQELIDYVSKEISIATGERITCVEFIQHTENILIFNECVVVDVETRKVLSKNQTGEICARGPSVMKGYLGIDEKTVFDDDGFFCSGDLGYFDEDDCLYIVGRLKDVFKYKGIQIPPHMKLRGGVQFISELPRNIRASLVMANEEEKPNTVSKSIEDLVHCIYRKCKDESVSGIQIPVELYEERVLNYTNVPRQLLNKILEQKTNFPSFDLFERIIISDNILEMYNKQKSFSFKDIYENIGSQIKVTELSQFCREMALVGYEHVNTLNCGQIVLENPKLAQERLLYLNKIKKLRNVQKPVYYLDERIIDFNQSFKKPWLTDADISKIDGYIFLHIVSKTGFQKGLFCNQPNAEDLIKWISDIVLSTLLPSSVIIMDKSPLHGKTEAEHITRYHSKEDMICVSWVIASEEKTARPDDSVNPHAEHSEYRRLIKAESSSDVGSSVDEKDEKDDKIKKVVKSVGGPVEKAVEKSSDSSSDSSGSGERRKKRAVKFHQSRLFDNVNTLKNENLQLTLDENRALVERLIKYKSKDADKMNEENEHFLKSSPTAFFINTFGRVSFG